MSQNTVPLDFLSASPAPASEAGSDRIRHLRPVAPRASSRGRAALSPMVSALVAVGIILLILTAQLGLSIAISQGAYESRALQTEQRDLSRVERLLSQNVDKLASPQNLAENAASLGMVQNVQPAALRLSDGVILGSLDSETSEAEANRVPNSTLESMPVVDAEGLLVDRDAATDSATKNSDTQSASAQRWDGRLPAPETH